MTRRPNLSWHVVRPVLALVRRIARGRWWIEQTMSSEELVEDLIDLPGRQTFGDGVGAVVSRRYHLTFPARNHSPEDVMAWFCGDTEAQSPADYAAFSDPITHEGQQLTVHLAGPWEGPVEVVRRTPTMVVLATLDGHMEAGWIRFRTAAVEGEGDHAANLMRFEIESAARAGDPAFWLLHVVARVGRLVQTDMWASLLESAANMFSDTPAERVRITTTTHPGAASREVEDPHAEPGPASRPSG